MLGYRPLRRVANEQWWDNWAHNFILSMILWPVIAGLVVLMVMLVMT